MFWFKGPVDTWSVLDQTLSMSGGFCFVLFFVYVCVCVICLFVVVVPAAAIYLLITNVLNASQWEGGSSKKRCAISGTLMRSRFQIDHNHEFNANILVTVN